ncbi:relaxase/mobilization nuclease domain-containing protein [Desulfosporosinus nitroreducens]|uniref:Relaxase/mobilization nuclease domain-containing protein n=1 Tax=Desulfosporosinus nitroreducens TaxID=2018668 RepID=A0ABT8QT91_9FIRM|nr:relaxase/mobilization nuclease domain-containing protein [Desulfosporosinus nitroreducens]
MAIERVLKDEDSSKIVLDYIMNPNKTDLVTGVNCVPETAFEEMLMVKAGYNKQDGRQFIHIVQSFHPAEQVTPQQVHEIGVRLAKEFERFSGFQIVVSTHLDREHLHNHFVFNTVNMETGLKWQQSPWQMQQLKDFSDELCKNYDLSIIEHKGTQRESTGEHRAKKREQSWMHELRLAVDACKQTSTSRADFISNMQKLGYQVKWTDTRKDITFTTPEGRKCRNLRLDKTLSKESFQEAFRLNKEFGDPKAMARQIGQLELATKVSNMVPVEEELIAGQDIEGDEVENQIEQDTEVEDTLEEESSKEDLEDTIADLQETNYIVEWSDRYKEARTFLYGSKEVEQNLTEAYRLYLEEAQIGNALALHDLGRMYMDGLGVEMNPDIAQGWYSKALIAFRAVERGKSGSYPQYRIGKMYAAGLGTPQNYEEAADWFEMAVAKNHKYAQYSLAGLYYRGQGVEQSHTTAFSLYGKSAAQGNPYASYELAKMYRSGLGCNKDTAKADQHFKNAFSSFSALEADSHNDKLQYRLGQMLYTGTGTEKDAVKAVDYLEQSAKLGNVNAQYLLAKIYIESDSALENVERALEWLGKAAENGNTQAQYALGKLYRDGNHVEKDIVKAVALFKLSAEQKNQFAQYALGKLYLSGEEIPKDVEAAVKWLRASVEQENHFAQYTLGKLYLESKDVPKDVEVGLKLLATSAEHGNQFAQFQLGKIYLSGKEEERDKVLATYWLSLSAAQGNEYAQLLLEKMDSYNTTEMDFLVVLMQFFSTQNHGQNQSRNYPLSHLEGHALREKILELQFSSSMNWNKGQGYEH